MFILVFANVFFLVGRKQYLMKKICIYSGINKWHNFPHHKIPRPYQGLITACLNIP